MEANPALDKSLKHLLGTASFTLENSVPGQCYRPELKIMFKVPWVFLKVPSLSSRGIESRRALAKYLQAHQGIYVCSGHRVLTREIWNDMPNELEVMIGVTKILHKKPGITIESLLKIVNTDLFLKPRLRNMASLHEFLCRYSNFFIIEANRAVKTTIKSEFLNAQEMKQSTKVNNLVMIDSIQSFIKQQKDLKSCPVDIPKIHAHLQYLGFGVNASNLQNFVLQFYQVHQTSTWQTPQKIELDLVDSKSETAVAKMIRDIIKSWPINMGMIRSELENRGVLLSNSMLRSIMETHFPDYIIRNGIVLQDHEPYKALVERILSENCPISIAELRTALISQGLVLSRDLLTEMVVKSLEDYFISQGQIYLPNSETSQGKIMANLVMDKVHVIVNGIYPVNLDDLPTKLATKGIKITRRKLKFLINEYSSSHELRSNYLYVREDQKDQGKDSPQTVLELVMYLKSLTMNSSNTILDSNGRTLFKKDYLDNRIGENAIYGALKSMIITEEGIGLVQASKSQADQVSAPVLSNLIEPSPIAFTRIKDSSTTKTKQPDKVVENEATSALPKQCDITLEHPKQPPTSDRELVVSPIKQPVAPVIQDSKAEIDGATCLTANPISEDADTCPDDNGLSQNKVIQNFPEWAMYLEEALEITEDGINTAHLEGKKPETTREEATNAIPEHFQASNQVRRRIYSGLPDGNRKSKDKDNCSVS